MLSRSVNWRFVIIGVGLLFLLQVWLFNMHIHFIGENSSAQHQRKSLTGTIDESITTESSLHGIMAENRWSDNFILAAVVVMACNRPDYLKRTMDSLFRVHAGRHEAFPLYISQDGDHQETRELALSYGKNNVRYMNNLAPTPPLQKRGENPAYYRIASHYKFALDNLFLKEENPRVIILEDDMELSEDFFEYFRALSSLLDRDPTLLAVSSWNDNGKYTYVYNESQLYRQDFFSGLGWMLTRRLWDELGPKWPAAYWDDWLRLKENHKGRHTIRPEVCRTYNFGEQGSSKGQFFKEHLLDVRLARQRIDWNHMDLSYLRLPNYDKFLKNFIDSAEEKHMYSSRVEFEMITSKLGLMSEWKDGIPRAGYNGTVVFRKQGSAQKGVIYPNPDVLVQGLYYRSP